MSGGAFGLGLLVPVGHIGGRTETERVITSSMSSYMAGAKKQAFLSPPESQTEILFWVSQF